MARSLVWGTKKTLSHVNVSPAHLIACVRVLGRILDVLFIQYLMPNTVPRVLVLLALFLHLRVVGVDDGPGEVNREFILLFSLPPDLVVVLDVDKILAFQAETLCDFRPLVASTVPKL